MVMPMAWSEVADWSGPDPRPAAYRDYKDRMLHTAVEALLADFPALRGRIVRAEASTPQTTAHYTRSPNGAMYGHDHAVDQMGRYRPSNRLRLKNVLLVGQGVGFPGILGVTLSAYYAVGYVLGIPTLLAELRAA